MTASTALYAFLLLLTASISAAAAILLWQRRVVLSAKPLLGLVIALCLWSASYSAFWLSTTPERQIFWLNVTYFGVVATPVLVLLFALTYTHREHRVTRSLVVWLSVEPVITLVLLWTDPLHELFFGGKRSAGSSTILDGGIGFWVHVIYSYALILYAIALLVQAYRRSRQPYRDQVGMMLFAVSLPLIGNVLSILNLSPFHNLDLTPVSFTVSTLIIGYALFYKRLFDIVPIARDKVMETIQEPVFVLDTTLRIIDLNPAAKRVLDHVSTRPYKSYIGESMSTFFASITQLDPADTLRRELQLMIDGQRRDYEYRLSPLLDAQQLQQGMVVVFNDITRHKQARAREIEIQLEKERTRVITEFIRMASHEFRTPLANINASAYLAARVSDLEKRIEKAKVIERHVAQITRLTDMMLLMTAVEVTPPVLHPVNVGALLHELAQDFKPTPEQPVLKVEIAAHLPNVQGNATFLSAAVAQMLDNARRFTPPQGTVTLRAYSVDHSISIEVEDTGMGIHAQDLPYIFDTFWRHDTAHSTPGLGLGLSITEKIVNLHSGKVHVTSEVGKGSLFRVTLPVETKTEQPGCSVLVES